MSRVSGDLPSAPQATVEPIVFFVRVSVDTIHRRRQEYSGRIARRYAAFSALSVAKKKSRPFLSGCVGCWLVLGAYVGGFEVRTLFGVSSTCQGLVRLIFRNVVPVSRQRLLYVESG